MISGPLWESYGNTPARWTLRLTTTLRANLKSFEHPLELQHRLELFGRFSRFWLHRPIFQFSMCVDVFRCVSMCFVLLADRCLILRCGTSENFQEPRKPLWQYGYIWIIHMDNMDSGGWSICDVNGISCSIFEVFWSFPGIHTEDFLHQRIGLAVERFRSRSCAPWSRSNSRAKMLDLAKNDLSTTYQHSTTNSSYLLLLQKSFDFFFKSWIFCRFFRFASVVCFSNLSEFLTTSMCRFPSARSSAPT